MTTHETEVLTVPHVTITDASVYRPVCSCGWFGRTSGEWFDAEEDATDHAPTD